MYNLFKFIHVLTVIVWIGGSIVLNILSGGIWKSNDAHRILSFGEDAELIGSRVFAPASGLLLLSGIATVLAVDASLFRKTWVALGVVGWIAVAAISGGLLGPLSQRLKRVLAESGPANPDVRRILQRIERLTRVELVLFVLMIADMIFKPGA